MHYPPLASGLAVISYLFQSRSTTTYGAAVFSIGRSAEMSNYQCHLGETKFHRKKLEFHSKETLSDSNKVEMSDNTPWQN